jgi:hypothetical protein
MTLTDLLDALYSDLGYEAIPSTTVTKRLTKYLNDGYRHLMSMPELSPLRMGVVSFASEPGRTLYGVPQSLVQINAITDPTGGVRLRLMTLDEFRAIDPQEHASGTPTHYIPAGFHPVQRQPNHTPVYAVSSNALDTTQVITMDAVLNYDNVDAASYRYTVTLNGLVPVLVAPSIEAVQRITMTPATTPTTGGTVHFYDVAVPDPAHRIGTIPAGQTTMQYLGIRLWPTPSDARLYHVDGNLTLSDMLQANESSLLPVDFQDILTDFARMREYEYRDDSRYAMAVQGYQQKLKYLRDRVMNPADYRPRVGRLVDRANNLDHDGVHFPAGRW